MGDFLSYLKKCKQDRETICEMIGAIYIPLCVVILTMGINLDLNIDWIKDINDMSQELINEYMLNGYFNLSCILLFILIFFMCIFKSLKMNIRFYEDLMKIIELNSRDISNHL